jgi:hypothetical protein
LGVLSAGQVIWHVCLIPIPHETISQEFEPSASNGKEWRTGPAVCRDASGCEADVAGGIDAPSRLASCAATASPIPTTAHITKNSTLLTGRRNEPFFMALPPFYAAVE